MKRTFIPTILFVVVSTGAIAQGGVHATFRDSSRGITSFEQDGVRYFIKIVPGDTTRVYPMPVYKGQEFVALDRMPEPVRRVQAEYPAFAKRAGLEGTVWLNCLVGTTGRVRAVTVTRSDAESLSKSAVAAALEWEFTPAMSEGKRVAAWVALPFKFKLETRK